VNWLILTYLFVLGACLGSFAGAMAWRIEKGKGVVRERSQCEHCGHMLGILDLIPILSWLVLRGRCRYCRRAIGPTPLLLELAMGGLFVLSYLAWPLSDTLPLASTLQVVPVFDIITLLVWYVALTLLAILFVYDLRHSILPDVITWPLAGVGLLLGVLRYLGADMSLAQVVTELALGLVPITGVYGLLWLVSRGAWIGLGDVKLGLFLGFALGWQAALLCLVLANFIGCLVILPAMLVGRLSGQSRIPFGPFLITAGVIAFLFGTKMVDVYVGLLI
jgi:leader peptidase (prepilin peptidase)/N-methyltransferase